MLSTFLYAFEAVMPLVLIIFLGYWLRRVGFFSDNFLAVGYKFSFRVALPCLLFYNVYSIQSFGEINFSTVLYAVLAVILLFLIGTAVALLWIPEKKQRGVVVQSFFRSNSAIVGVSLTEALGGASALQCVALVTAFTIPLFNILAVIALSAFCAEGENEKEREDGVPPKHGRNFFTAVNSINWKRIGMNILKNPLIIAIALGILCVVIRTWIPVNEMGEKVFLLSKQGKVLFSVVENLAKIASPFMLMVLGGQFTFSAVSGMKKQIVIGTAARILLAPILGIGAAWLLARAGVLTLGVAEYASFIALFASPVAVSSAIMAKEMGNDDILAGQLVVWTSIGSVFTIFLFAFVFRSIGLL